MPPRLTPLHVSTCCSRLLRPSTNPSSLLSLFAGLSIGTRNASILASLSDNKGAYNKRIRVGRGPSAGKGKTSGRGHKGQKQHGHVRPWFQGGQTPLIVQKGRKGFDNKRAPVMSKINLDKLQQWIDTGRIDPTKRITIKEIVESGLIGNFKDGIKLLARGKEELRQPIDIMLSRASATAIETVEKAGGKVLTRFYTRQSIKRLLNGEAENTDKPLPVGQEHVPEVLAEARKRGFPYRLPDPTSRSDIEYYRDPAHRGYLSHLLKEGESPSLFFKVPIQKQHKKVSKKRKAVKVAKEDALW
ncbi:50S ribosomal protein L15 [Colletotrichum sidae]|uniref:50S ribosomal protein L15 n=3 Tax=Colletotrichum orbiculare species complex TaxID=2707354 RepID=N4VZU2_COLOR|nr:50S ribosomal protein L15 [Colletotrichum orbiculare MAFF 240422]TDZ73421.1 50S ribosomal protein L15 [Colletotrichum trifolii]TEA14567.1 50S ribosomal protein L15 [Colletotrichum sidae]